ATARPTSRPCSTSSMAGCRAAWSTASSWINRASRRGSTPIAAASAAEKRIPSGPLAAGKGITRRPPPRDRRKRERDHEADQQSVMGGRHRRVGDLVGVGRNGTERGGNRREGSPEIQR